MKTKKLLIAIITILTVLSINAYAQEIGQWRTTQNYTVSDNPTGETIPTSYTLSILSNYYSVKKLQDAGMSWWQADLTTFSLGVLWEVKDGFVPLEKVPVIGGNGFSTTDLAVNASVIVANRILNFTLKKFVGYVSNKTSRRFASR